MRYKSITQYALNYTVFEVMGLKYNRIRDMREDNDLTQSSIAKILNIAQTTYSGYENGSRNIPVECVIKLALYYEVSTDYLLGLTKIKKPYPKEWMP